MTVEDTAPVKDTAPAFSEEAMALESPHATLTPCAMLRNGENGSSGMECVGAKMPRARCLHWRVNCVAKWRAK